MTVEVANLAHQRYRKALTDWFKAKDAWYKAGQPLDGQVYEELTRTTQEFKEAASEATRP